MADRPVLETSRTPTSNSALGSDLLLARRLGLLNAIRDLVGVLGERLVGAGGIDVLDVVDVLGERRVASFDALLEGSADRTLVERISAIHDTSCSSAQARTNRAR
jgi:hypothetical protein